MPRVNDQQADTIAEASSVYGLQELANWLPPDQHERLKEVLFDLVYSSIYAYVDLEAFRIPDPSVN